jgi:glutamate-1-semialdehyde aminotransferase
MVRLTRSGGEANSVAIRIARAATSKTKIAFCGYHGWHDWYLSANLKNKNNLNAHLIKGLSTKGVPKSLAGTSLPFRYNDFDGFYKLIKQNPDIGIVKMEVVRNDMPHNNFLEKVREITSKKGIILIFDECTSGFRQTYGGLHKFYKVNPDMAIFGKALGNGYAINAIIGKEEIMRYAEETFISSTFWTERIGPTAALKTLEEMKKIKSWNIVTNKGNWA